MKERFILVSNGPGELQTWVRPVLKELQRQAPQAETVISLIPCQFASGSETRIAREFGATQVTTPAEAVRAMAGSAGPDSALSGRASAVIGLGGNTRMAIRLANRLHAPVYRYSFVPYWHPKLTKLYVHDDSSARKARLLGAPRARLENIGNLVADAVGEAEAAPSTGAPHLLLMSGSRDRYVKAVLPFMLATLDLVAEQHPDLQVSWPVSRLVSAEALATGISATGPEVIGGHGGQREGDTIITPGGLRIELVDEQDRYAYMKAADLALTIPGTNTLELGIAGTPAVVVLPLNRPEIIPLEGPGNWLSLLPVVGTPLKRRAVKLFVERFRYPVSLPNQFSGEQLMSEVKGILQPEQVAAELLALLADEGRRQHISGRLQATMPRPGAAQRLVSEVLAGRARHE